MSRRIGTVLRIRELQERLARAEVARAQGEVAVATRREAAAWSALAARDRVLAGHLPAGGLAARRMQLDGGLSAGVRAEAAVGSARQAADTAIAGWTVAARAHDGVERLADRIATAERDAETRKAAVELDELVVQRHGRGA